MVSDFNTVFGRAWFGPFSQPRPLRMRPRHASPVYDLGPLDGLKTASMWAHRMSPVPLLGQAQVTCPPGQVAYQGRGGGIHCTSAPSEMIGPYGAPGGPPPVPNRRTFEVGPWWGNNQ